MAPDPLCENNLQAQESLLLSQRNHLSCLCMIYWHVVAEWDPRTSSSRPIHTQTCYFIIWKAVTEGMDILCDLTSAVSNGYNVTNLRCCASIIYNIMIHIIHTCQGPSWYVADMSMPLTKSFETGIKPSQNAYALYGPINYDVLKKVLTWVKCFPTIRNDIQMQISFGSLFIGLEKLIQICYKCHMFHNVFQSLMIRLLEKF